jgi:hypothetical protein
VMYEITLYYIPIYSTWQNALVPSSYIQIDIPYDILAPAKLLNKASKLNSHIQLIIGPEDALSTCRHCRVQQNDTGIVLALNYRLNCLCA